MNEKNKKIIVISIIAIVLIALVIIILCNVSIEKENTEIINNEIIPQEEISDEQYRETTVELYYLDGENKLIPEIKKIDSKDLLANPYEVVLQLLLQGPQDNSLKTEIPRDTKVNKIVREGDCLNIDLSKEFAADNNENNQASKQASINQIVYTLTQFSEINKVKLSVDGDASISLADNLSLDQEFTRAE